MRIIHVAAELAPLAKVGGLGDVVLGLSRVLLQMGHQVEIIIPKYDCLDKSFCKNMKLERSDLKSYEGGNWYANSVWSAEVESCKVFFLEPHHPQSYFKEGSIYTDKMDIPRFIYFSRLAMEFLQQRKEPIDILHLHDWHTAVSTILFQDLYRPLGLNIKGICLNIHNLEYQGKCAAGDLDKIGLDSKKYLNPENLQDDNPAFPKTINLLKGGIVFADQVITVSPNYAKEILTVEMAFDMQSTLRKHENKVIGILNGIDTEIWSPGKDVHVPASYSAQNSAEEILKAKGENKKILQKKLGLREEPKPLVACISRLVPQKGPTLIKEGLLHALKKHAQCVLLGSSTLPDLQKEFAELKEKLKSNPQIFFHFEYNEPLSRLLYSAADFVLVPSLFEPCGLTQLIGLRYGAIPIVRRTGGLADTIFDADNKNIMESQRNGYTFDTFDSIGIDDALDRALHCWQNEKEKYKALLKRGISMDFGWKKSAQEYLKTYEQLIKLQ